MTVEFPFEIGQKVYEASGRCSDLCFRKNISIKNRALMKCEGFGGKCYTRYFNPTETRVKEDNAFLLKRKWGTEIFATKEEAFEAAKSKCRENKTFWKKRGIKFNKEGIVTFPPFKKYKEYM